MLAGSTRTSTTVGLSAVNAMANAAPSLRGEFDSDSPISQVQLAARLGVSWTPLREALRMLQREGLIDSEPNRRVRVAQLTVADLEELYAARIVIESLGARLAVPILTAGDLAEMRRMLTQMTDVKDHDLEAWDVWHRAFHDLLKSRYGDRLSRTAHDLFDYTERYRHVHLTEPHAWSPWNGTTRPSTNPARLETRWRQAADIVRGSGTQLRPHVKTHRTPGLAIRQLGPHTRGVACATVGEAEAMVEAGIDDIFLANEIVAPGKAERLARLAHGARIALAVDSRRGVEVIAAAADRAGTVIGAVVDVDIGLARCGVQGPNQAVELGRRIAESPRLRLEGLMGYEGAFAPTTPNAASGSTGRQHPWPPCGMLSRQLACPATRSPRLAPPLCVRPSPIPLSPRSRPERTRSWKLTCTADRSMIAKLMAAAGACSG